MIKRTIDAYIWVTGLDAAWVPTLTVVLGKEWEHIAILAGLAFAYILIETSFKDHLIKHRKNV